MNTRKSPNILTPAPCGCSKRAMCKLKRALHTLKRALHTLKRALHPRKRALHPLKIALYTLKRALHPRKEPYIHSKQPYIHSKEPKHSHTRAQNRWGRTPQYLQGPFSTVVMAPLLDFVLTKTSVMADFLSWTTCVWKMKMLRCMSISS